MLKGSSEILVAVKMVKGNVTTAERGEFLDEASLLLNLDEHPHVLKVC